MSVYIFIYLLYVIYVYNKYIQMYTDTCHRLEQLSEIIVGSLTGAAVL